MKYLALPVLLAAVGCASGDLDDRDSFYERLGLALIQYNGSMQEKQYQAQTNIELELSRMTTPRFEWLAKDAIEESDDDRRNLAVWGISFCRQPQAAQILKGALNDPNPVVRGSAAVGIARQDSPDAPYDKIFALLDDSRPYLRQSGLCALKMLFKPGQDRGKIARICALLGDASPDVRNEAALVLHRLRMKESIPSLVDKGLSDPSPLVRGHSAMALGAMGTDGVDANYHLIETLKDGENHVVEAAWWSLKKINGLDFDRSYHLWRDWFEDQRKFEYYCPTHTQTIKEAPGYCPECGRKFEKQPKSTKPKSP